MNRIILAFLLGSQALVGPGFATTDPVEGEMAVVIRLSNGREVSGRILEDGFDEAVGVTMRRDDNGGRLALRWDQIHPDDVTAIKRRKGFIGDDLPAVLIDAVEVEVRGGNTFVGVNLGTEGDKMILSKLGQKTPIPLGQIKKIRNVKVDALDLENPLTVYERRRAEVQPETAVEYYNLGLFAESLTLFDLAEECFDTTLALDPDFSKSDLIAQRVKNLAVKKKEAAANDMLRRIDNLTRRGFFPEAIELVAEFKETWPRSLLMPDLLKQEAEIANRRRDSLLHDIKADFFKYLRHEAQLIARDREMELGKAMTWAEEDAYPAVVEHLVTLYQTSEEEIDDLWANRGNTGSPYTFSYGGGTFILGEDAREGVVDSLEKKKKDEEKQKAGGDEKKKKSENSIMDKIAEQLAKNKKKRDSSKKKKDDGSLSDIPPTPEEWWAAAPVTERQFFVLSWFAEKTKHTNVVRIDGRKCSTCSGKGIIEFFGANLAAKGNNNANKKSLEKMPCPRCKRLGFDRFISVR